jgi:hypothetical protein
MAKLFVAGASDPNSADNYGFVWLSSRQLGLNAQKFSEILGLRSNSFRADLRSYGFTTESIRPFRSQFTDIRGWKVRRHPLLTRENYTTMMANLSYEMYRQGSAPSPAAAPPVNQPTNQGVLTAETGGERPLADELRSAAPFSPKIPIVDEGLSDIEFSHDKDPFNLHSDSPEALADYHEED